ncbi:MAG: short-chain dehydrogenase [Oleibacter sp.]|nr:short-chain dehydrogenase [Thalassolituus sp.]
MSGHPEKPLKGKVALVTGASKGIGRAMALALAEQGAKVAICHHADAANASATLELLQQKTQALAADIDVSVEFQVSVFFDQVEAVLGTPDIIISNAGIIHEAPLIETRVEDFDRVVGVNLRGCFLVNREAVRRLKRQNIHQGRIINIASDLGYLGREDMVSYCASKGGVMSLTRTLARELAPGILVNAIAPGPIDTDMTSIEHMSEDALAKDLNSPLARFGSVDDIAAMAVFLAGPQAGFITGQCFGVNGGSVMP